MNSATQSEIREIVEAAVLGQPLRGRDRLTVLRAGGLAGPDGRGAAYPTVRVKRLDSGRRAFVLERPDGSVASSVGFVGVHFAFGAPAQAGRPPQDRSVLWVRHCGGIHDRVRAAVVYLAEDGQEQATFPRIAAIAGLGLDTARRGAMELVGQGRLELVVAVTRTGRDVVTGVRLPPRRRRAPGAAAAMATEAASTRSRRPRRSRRPTAAPASAAS